HRADRFVLALGVAGLGDLVPARNIDRVQASLNVLGHVARSTPRQVCGDVHRTLTVAPVDPGRTTGRTDIGDLAQLNRLAPGRNDRDLADLLDARALVGIQNHVNVPAGGPLGTECPDPAARQPRAQHAPDRPWGEC